MQNKQLFETLIGPITLSSSTPSDSTLLVKYESDFVKFEADHWAADGASWSKSNYYDRAFLSYVAYARTGDATYLEHANAIAEDYLKNYVEANDYGVASWWSMPKGLTAHYLINGDQASLTAIGKMADHVAAPSYVADNWAYLFDPRHNEGREQARALETLTQAIIVDAPSVGVPSIQPNGDDWGVAGGNDFRALAKSLVEKILTSDYQNVDGSRPSYAGEQLVERPFMNGLMNEALINYYEQVEADPRIVEFIKKNLDYMWSNQWVDSAKAFQYVSEPTSAGESDAPTPDLNMLIVSGFGFVYQHTGDETYRLRGDLVFEGGVEGAWLEGSKQFNQQYASSYNYIAYAHPEWSVGVPASPAADPDAISPNPNGAETNPGELEAGKADPQQEASSPLTGTSGVDVLHGGSSDDELYGLDGADKLYGESGNDILIGGAGSDRLVGGEGVDTACYVTAAASVTADLAKPGNNRGDAHGDKFVSIENLEGSNFADSLSGNAGVNVLVGNAGDDKLHGRAGNDTLDGGDGDDHLYGGSGHDLLFGGAGSDMFIFQRLSDSPPASFDVVMDFAQGADLIDLHAIDANAELRGDQAFNYIGEAEFSGKAGELRVADRFVSADINGDKISDLLIEVSGVTSLSAADFYL